MTHSRARFAVLSIVTLATIAPAIPACADGNVIAGVEGGTLVLVGDDLDNSITVDRGMGVGSQQLRVTPTDGTMVNDAPVAGIFDGITGGIVGTFGGGGDRLTVTTVVELAGGIVVDGGDGDSDGVIVTGSVVQGDLKFAA